VHHGKRHSAKGAGAAPATARDPHGLEQLLGEKTTPADFCSELAKLFQVRATEVALLQLEGGLLKFLFPEALKTAGAIPLSSSTAIAAHTVSTRKVELFNSFARVKHASIFETVRLGASDQADSAAHAPIQKLMSAPIVDSDGEVLGVIQVCRKGFDAVSAGADFTLADLTNLERAAVIVAKASFLQIA